MYMSDWCSIYEDVIEAFEKWKESDIDLFIYSSGSVAAQKLLFGFSDRGREVCTHPNRPGNLLSFIKGHFDTTIGLKVYSDSYKNIVGSVYPDSAESVKHILFVTDNIEEAKASTSVGMPTALAVRPGNVALPEGHKIAPEISSFLQLFELFTFRK
jgi:enolase-phosphatase E1